jgi:hypothetical protein
MKDASVVQKVELINYEQADNKHIVRCFAAPVLVRKPM